MTDRDFQIKGIDAVNIARDHGLSLRKYGDPIDPKDRICDPWDDDIADILAGDPNLLELADVAIQRSEVAADEAEWTEWSVRIGRKYAVVVEDHESGDLTEYDADGSEGAFLGAEYDADLYPAAKAIVEAVTEGGSA